MTYHLDPFLGEADLCRSPRKCRLGVGSHYELLEAALTAATAATTEATVRAEGGGFVALPQEAKLLRLDGEREQELRAAVARANEALRREGWSGAFKATEAAKTTVVPFKGSLFEVPVKLFKLEGGPEAVGDFAVIGHLRSTKSGLLLQVRPGAKFTAAELPTCTCRGCLKPQEELLMVTRQEELLGGYCKQCLPAGLSITPESAAAAEAPELMALVGACSGLQGFAPEALCKPQEQVWPLARVLAVVKVLFEKEGFVPAAAGPKSTKVKTLSLLQKEARGEEDRWSKAIWRAAANRDGEALRRLAQEGLQQRQHYNREWGDRVEAVLKQDFVHRTDIGFLASCLVFAQAAEAQQGLRAHFPEKAEAVPEDLTVKVLAVAQQTMTDGTTWLQVTAREQGDLFRVFWSTRHGEAQLQVGEEVLLHGVTVQAREQHLLRASGRLAVESWERKATGETFSEL